MNTETFFTLAEYKSNFDRLKKEFVEAYIDNDEEEFITQQTEWYRRCVENTKIEYGILADGAGWDTAAMLTGENLVWEVDKKVRTKEGGLDKNIARNLNVSFKKILNFLNQKQEKIVSARDVGKPFAVQWALYYYFLQKSSVMPSFQEKLKEIKILSKEYGVGWKNFEMKYNVINNSQGLEGYSEKDVKAVIRLLKDNYPTLIPEFEKLTLRVS